MQTILYNFHINLGAKIVPFNDWMMPLYYQGIIPEHIAVRTSVGLFDVSHMGQIEIVGTQADAFVDYISTNYILEKTPGSAIYTILCNPQGGCIDDVIIFKGSSQRFLLVGNAGNREKDLMHLQKISKNFDVQVSSRYDSHGILAIQGPKAASVLARIFDQVENISPMHFVEIGTVLISRTGYTGEDGYEIYAPNSELPRLWQQLMDAGKDNHIVPVGLGARDTLRLEMGYALYGHEIDETIAPTESVAAWTVKGDKEFIGRDALRSLSHKRAEYGVILVGEGVVRAGYEVFKKERKIGYLTSGGYSPSLQKSIGLVIVEEKLENEEEIEVQIRQKKHRAKVVKLPFLKELA